MPCDLRKRRITVLGSCYYKGVHSNGTLGNVDRLRRFTAAVCTRCLPQNERPVRADNNAGVRPHWPLRYRARAWKRATPPPPASQSSTPTSVPVPNRTISRTARMTSRTARMTSRGHPGTSRQPRPTPHRSPPAALAVATSRISDLPVYVKQPHHDHPKVTVGTQDGRKTGGSRAA